MRYWASKRLDYSAADWLFAVTACGLPGLSGHAESLEARWAPSGDGMSGLSVRSLFDLVAYECELEVH